MNKLRNIYRTVRAFVRDVRCRRSFSQPLFFLQFDKLAQLYSQAIENNDANAYKESLDGLYLLFHREEHYHRRAREKITALFKSEPFNKTLEENVNESYLRLMDRFDEQIRRAQAVKDRVSKQRKEFSGVIPQDAS